MEGNTYTHTQTHTHTHTHTNTQTHKHTHTHTHTHKHILPGTVVYRCQVGKGKVLSRHRYKETRILLVNTVAFF